MSELVGISLNSIPFLNSCDSTRLQMAQKYVIQALCHENNDIPKLYTTGIYKLTNYSDYYIKRAKDDGVVIYEDDTIIMVYYQNIQEVEIYDIYQYENVYSDFALKLRKKLKTGDKFKKGDIIYEYVGFVDGLPTGGYNTLVLFLPLFLYNYEDAIIISESYAKRCKSYQYQELFIPVYKDTILLRNEKDEFIPKIGDVFNEEDIIVATSEYGVYKGLNEVIKKDRTIREIVENCKIYRCSMDNMRVFDVKVYRCGSEKCIDEYTNDILEARALETDKEILKVKKSLELYINDSELVNKILKKYYLMRKRRIRELTNVKDINYIIQVKLIKDEETLIGDKFSNRGANKGVVSTIVPDELMPKTEDGKVIDMIISPFAIPSRMNVNQIYELYISKLVKFAEDLLLKKIKPKVSSTITDKDVFLHKLLPLQILRDIIEKFSLETKQMQLQYINLLLSDEDEFKKFLEDVKQNGLYIIVDNFKSKKYTKKDILELFKKYEKYGVKFNENVIFNPRKLARFLLNKDINYLPDKEIKVKGTVGYLYVYKLMHLASHKINARSIGPYLKVLKLPTKGRRNEGGSRIGNDEYSMLLAYKAFNVINEFIITKADDHEEKRKFMYLTINGKEYHTPKEKSKSYVKATISALLKSLFYDFDKEINKYLQKRKEEEKENVWLFIPNRI